jgi:membrane protein
MRAAAEGGSRSLGEWARLAVAAAQTVLRAFEAENLRMRAMGLVYISIFALVPALVVTFSVVEAFTGMEKIVGKLHDFLIGNLAVGAQATIAPYLDRFTKNAHARSAGLVGGLILVASMVSLFGNVERALNDIWAVRRRRPLVQRALTYWAGLTLGPILLAASVALAHAAPVRGRFLAVAASALLTWAFFVVLYAIVPATRVRLPAALLGGAVASFFRYHAVYGSLAAIPIFLLWLYLSWLILLFGARVAFVAQHARALLGRGRDDATPLGRELLAARVMLEVARAYHRTAPPPEPTEMAERLQTLAEPVREVLGLLRVSGLVVEVAGGGMVPSRPLSSLTLADVRRVVAGPLPEAPRAADGALLSGILAGAEGAAADSLARTSLEELCRRLDAMHSGGSLAEF